MTRWTSSSRPDQDGRFKFGNLPPGAYYAIAVEYVALGEWSDPEWLARARKKATRFTAGRRQPPKTLDLEAGGILAVISSLQQRSAASACVIIRPFRGRGPGPARIDIRRSGRSP